MSDQHRTLFKKMIHQPHAARAVEISKDLLNLGPSSALPHQRSLWKL